MPDGRTWPELLVWMVCLFPIWGGLLLHVWSLGIRPRLIPAAEIRAIADALIVRHGPLAEEFAFIEEDRAWRTSDTFQQGKWHRVRRELRRRYEAGEWAGPGDDRRGEASSRVR